MSLKTFPAATAFLLLAACETAPFGYAEDRCLGEHNQCQAACASIDSGPARAACAERCYSNENRCYATGASGDGGSLATDRAIGAARSEAEKAAGYEEFKARKERERAAAGNGDENEPTDDTQ